MHGTNTQPPRSNTVHCMPVSFQQADPVKRDNVWRWQVQLHTVSHGSVCTLLSASWYEPRASTWFAILLTWHFTSCDSDWMVCVYNTIKCAVALCQHNGMWHIHAPYITRHSDLCSLLCLAGKFKQLEPSLVRLLYITLLLNIHTIVWATGHCAHQVACTKSGCHRMSVFSQNIRFEEPFLRACMPGAMTVRIFQQAKCGSK
jgi:hypothetical protein